MLKMKVMPLVMLVAMLLSMGYASAANVAVSITATAQSTIDGYIEDETYTFDFVLPGNPTCTTTFTSNVNTWDNTTAGDDYVVTSITPSESQGSFVYPETANTQVKVYWPGLYIYVISGSYGDYNSLGITTPDGTDIGFLSMSEVNLLGNSFVYTATTPVSIESYFSDYYGSYTATTAATNPNIYIRTAGASMDDIILDVNSIAISEVPEPATLAILAAGGVVLLRRKLMK